MQKKCIVVPCYNEEQRFPLNSFIEGYNSTDYYYFFVNDGSSDLTIDVLNKLRQGREDRIFVLDLKNNGGKGEAVRHGFLEALTWQDFSIIGYLDADLATPIDNLPPLINQLNDPVLFVFGSRVQRIGATIQRKWYRHIAGRAFATIASNLLNIRVYDTQCGAKFFHVSIVKALFTEKFTTTWIFDLELFFRFLNLHKNQDVNVIAKEIPLETWVDVGGSSLSLSYVLKIPFELMKLKKYIKQQA